MRLFQTLLPRAVAIALSCAATTLPAADWMQFGYDAAHTGYNPVETTIGAANVALLTAQYNVALPASVDSAPVYLSNVETPGGTKNLLFALSENGRLMAIDAASGTEVWHASQSGRQPTTASPAIDPNRQYVYSYGVDGYAHKYQVGDGTEITGGGWPQTVTLKPDVEKGASGLTIAETADGTYLVVVTDGYIGDGGDYQGHVTTIDLASGAQVVFNTLCSNLSTHLGNGDCARAQSGIWGRGGAVYDSATDHVYVTTGNGQYNASTGGFNWGDSLLALAHDGTGAGAGMPRDSYTPTNFQQLDNQDTDLGSISMVVMQPPSGSTVAHLGMQTGKDHQLRLINLDDMSGQGGPAHVGGELQLLSVPQGGGGMREQPATWVDGAGVSWLFVANGSGLSGLKLGLNGSNVPQLSSVWQKTNSTTSPIVANGILYSISSCSGGTCVVARDPQSGDALWTSTHISGPHWQSPILVDGVVYVVDGSSKLWAFAPGAPPITHIVTPTAGSGGSIAPNTPQTVNDGNTTSFTVTPDAQHQIADVSGCGGQLSGTTYTTGAISADCTVSATFDLIVTHTVTPSAGSGGSIAPDAPQTVNDGDTKTFTITPDAHYQITDVSGCGGQLSGNTYTTGPVTADCTVSATFAIITHTVTPNAGDGGQGSIDPSHAADRQRRRHHELHNHAGLAKHHRIGHRLQRHAGRQYLYDGRNHLELHSHRGVRDRRARPRLQQRVRRYFALRQLFAPGDSSCGFPHQPFSARPWSRHFRRARQFMRPTGCSSVMTPRIPASTRRKRRSRRRMSRDSATRYSVSLPATVGSAPVYLSNVATSGGTRNLLFALATNGRMMAIDAATGTEVWHATQSGTQPTTASPAIDPEPSIRLQLRRRRLRAQIQGRRRHRDHQRRLARARHAEDQRRERRFGGLTIATSGGTNWLYSVTDGYIGDGGDYQGH